MGGTLLDHRPTATTACSRRSPAWTPLAAVLIVLAGALPACRSYAQSIYLDADGDGLWTQADVLAPSGETVLDVWLRTDRNRDGTVATCPGGGAELSIRGYHVVLRAQNGTVIWQGITNQEPAFTLDDGSVSSELELAGGFVGTAFLSPGLHRLCSVRVAPSTGTPSIEFAGQSTLSDLYETSFESACSGEGGDSVLRLGVDWFDADGVAYGGVANRPPVLTDPAPVSLDEGTLLDVPLSASDEDGDPLAFSLVSGPAYASVSTIDPGPLAAGLLRLGPGQRDAGSAVATVLVWDGISSDAATVGITVRVVNAPPAVTLPAEMMTPEGIPVDVTLDARDADGDQLTFSLLEGPRFLTTSWLQPEPGVGFAVLHFAPGYDDAGMYPVSASVSDGAAAGSVGLMFMVRDVNRAPILVAPEAIRVPEGDPISFVATGSDPDGDMLMIEATGLPRGAQFVDRMDGTGLFDWTPAFDQAGAYAVELMTDDRNGFTARATVTITVDDVIAPVALSRPADVAIDEGGISEQRLWGFDASGDPVSFLLVSGPGYASVQTIEAGTGLAAGLVRLAPGYEDAGEASVTVALTDGGYRVERVFAVSVRDVGSGPPPDGPPFAPPFATIPTGATPHTVTAGDLNGDGHLDLAVANLGSNSLSVRLGRGDGSFGPRMDLATAARPHTVAIRDLNGDGIRDLAATQVGANSIASFLGIGDGTFGPRRELPIGGSPLFLGLEDFDQDGVCDVVATDQTAGALVYLAGRGDGTFAVLGSQPTGGHPHGLAIADLNADGRADVVVANEEPRTVSVLLGRGDGSFAPAPDLTTSAPHTVSAADWNGDHAPDLAVANFAAGTVSLFLGRGDGRFDPAGEIASGTQAHAAAVADVDGDGRADLLVVNQGSSTLSILLGRNDGSFAPKVDYSVAEGAHSIAVADVDEDGLPDVLVSGIVGNEITVLINRGKPVRPARAFVPEADRLFLLRAARPWWHVAVEPSDGSFQAAELDPTSVELERSGVGALRIAPSSSKPAVLGDRDRNGTPDLLVTFAGSDVDALFQDVRGRAGIPVVLTGRLHSGVRIRADLTVSVIGAGTPGPPHVAPNPVNPAATIRYETSRAGPVTIVLYDVAGRPVRRLLGALQRPAGPQKTRFEARDDRGTPLASGVYFFRIETVDGVRSGRFAVVK